MAKPKPLIIVESPAKAKTISRFLGNRYQVKASMGHVRDLPKSQFGVDVEKGFEPRYITIRGKGSLVKELRDAAKKTDRVYLATDPDREGEAIAWHLGEALGIKPDEARRIEFHEITKDAVTEAIRHARPVNMHLVDAQQARRVLDRVVGYQLSPLLWRKVRPGLSAGRVQSAALKLIVDREREIEAFNPEEYFTIQLTVQSEPALLAEYAGPLGEKGRVSQEEAQDVVKAVQSSCQAQVMAVKTRERRRFPANPFTTSTLQQEASRRLGFSVKRTMSLAQQLYEGLEVAGEGTVGLVTYIRTDSTRVAEVAVDEARTYIETTFGSSYWKGLAAPKRPEKEKPGVQGAHEAIRPTAVMRHPDALKGSLTRDQLRLYRLIWERFVASQMAPMVYDATTIEVQSAGHTFRAHGAVVKFPGFTTLYQETREEGEDEASRGPLPLVSEGDQFRVAAVEPSQHFTEPPPRFSEASLVKTLEELGVGRPSTYAPIIDTLLQRDYVRRDQKRLFPTELGVVVVDLLQTYFPEIVDISFTAAIEDQLDRVEDAETEWRRVLTDFYRPFSEELARADEDIEKVELASEVTDEVCNVCGKPMVVKYGRFGKFLACSGYPECTNTQPLVEKTGGLCPKCGADLVVRRSKRGRTFYGCRAYPNCDFVTWWRPTEKACPRCGASMALRRKGRQDTLVCLKEGCGFEEEAQ
ncbi:type I DNA topoisomerase [Sulfobacillus harzensis]|uniref:DNA topoisomerase 1 n=1 Tax=Sulfobacillus harzensis TaxID=2729629 RepID=A0A7Y0L7W2_9FIRM|nr:type I DNA topoisomerase [Sulfobacillus harzensis]NMP24060.1 type I DNA topoisomerase [Sulfobacillus harzensis]